MKRTVSVKIAGQRYSLRGDSDEGAVRKVAEFVDARIKAVQAQTQTADSQSLAVLAALQIAEELFAERRARADLKKTIKERTRSLLEFLERQARV